MTAFDTDILSELIAGTPAYTARASKIPAADQRVPTVAASENLRGWLNAIRQAEAGKGSVSLPLAYELFGRSLLAIAKYTLLAYTPPADGVYLRLRAAKIRIGTGDLRIAATCLDVGATLATRNARDFSLVPGLKLDIWP